MTKIKKRLISLFLISAMVSSTSICTFAQSNAAEQSLQTKKVELEKKLDALSKKSGAKFTVLDKADENTVFKFASMEEFEKWVEGFTAANPAVVKNKAEITVEPTLTTTDSKMAPRVVNSYQRTAHFDNSMIDPTNTFWLGVIRHKIVVDCTYNYTFGLYCFGTVSNHLAYIYGSQVGSSWEWTTDSQSTGKLDSGRTLWGKINGHVKVTAQIADLGVGMTWDRTFYDEWYATSTQVSD